MATYYNGYRLSANSSITSQQLSSAFSTITDSLAEIITAAEQKYTELETFAAEEPSVAVSAMSIDLADVSSSVDQTISDVVSKIMGIINSIVDYGDGKWDNENNKSFLDGFMASNGLGYNPGGGPGGSPSAPPTPNVEPTVENPEIENDVSVEVPVSSPVVENDYISENVGDYSYSNTSYEVPFVPQSYSEENELQSSLVTPSGVSTSFSDTFFDSATNFAVPTISSKKVAGVKSSGVVGIAGIAAAAALAIGGKIYYDKQHEEDEEFEEILEDEGLSTRLDETGTDLVEEAISNLNVVRFKEGILSMGEGDA